VATYERVSSDDQRERETIKTQTDQLDRWLEREPDVEIVARFSDDGVSGTRPLAERPGGQALLAAAEAGRFDELWLYKLDRLGRNLADTAATGRRLEGLNVSVVTLREGRLTPFMFDLFATLAQNEHRVFHERSADGMETAAREGRYTGGVTALGYRIEGAKRSARPVPDEAPMWGDLSAAELIRRIYNWIALEGWSCRRVATELNALGVPTACAREGTGVRARKTQSIWRAGLIRNMVTNSIYKGQLSYGRRTKKRDREVIVGSIEALVSPALWDEAQATLARNRRCAKNTPRHYLLRGVMRCGICNLTYVGSWSKDVGWYRCGGQIAERGLEGHCPGCSLRTDRIEPAVWADIERFLRDPGEVLDELDAAREREAQGAIAEAEAITLGRALDGLEAQRKQALNLNIRGRLPDPELDDELDRINRERTELEARVAALEAPYAEVVPQEARDLLAEVRARLDAGLTDEQRQEIVRLLVGIVVHTETPPDGKKTVRAVVTYRFPCVVPTRTGTGSWPRAIGTAKVTRRPDRHAISPPGHRRVAGAGRPAWPGRAPAIRSGTTRCYGPPVAECTRTSVAAAGRH
jgi:site-specific DNA recombinase